MAEQMVVCPKCGNRFPLSEAITHQIAERYEKEHAKEMETLERKYVEREKAKVKALEAKQSADLEKLQKSAFKAAAEKVGTEMQALQEKVGAFERKAEAFKTKEQEYKEKLASAREEIDKKVESKLRVERLKVAEEAQAKAEKGYKLKLAESKKQNEDLVKKIAELQRKANQGSVQLQGEVQELEIEDILAKYFPDDEITPIVAGKRGGDVMQTVRLRSGKAVGAILWESKRTKAWVEGWIEKLKEDRQESKADLAAIVTEVLPKGILSFGLKDDIWVTELRYVVGLAAALRENIKSVHQMKAILANRIDKMQLIYNYLTGTQFKQRVESILGAFKEMQESLEAEKRAMERSWASREKQIRKFISNMAGMYGDLQGVGTPLPNVKLLEISQ